MRKIHFVTSGQKPEWLDENNPKIHLVNHKDFIPAEFLPTYNSVVIERYMYRIPGLADHFVYFNDDFYIINHITPERFFKNGLPCDIAVFDYNPSWSQWYVRIKNNIKIINRHFNKKEVMERWHDKWFDKSYGSKARWNYLLRFYNKFITSNRFRALTDYTPELFRIWQICNGDFEPYNTYNDTKMFPLMIKSKKAIKAIYDQSYSLICLNDNVHIRNYEEVMHNLQEAFESILPEKSSFEL